MRLDYPKTLANLDKAIAKATDPETRRGLVAIREHLADLTKTKGEKNA